MSAEGAERLEAGEGQSDGRLQAGYAHELSSAEQNSQRKVLLLIAIALIESIWRGGLLRYGSDRLEHLANDA